MLRSTWRGLETWHGRDGVTLADERARQQGTQTSTYTGAPVLDPTDERGEETERRRMAQATAPLLDFTNSVIAGAMQRNDATCHLRPCQFACFGHVLSRIDDAIATQIGARR